jgi:hypothetical protein
MNFINPKISSLPCVAPSGLTTEEAKIFSGGLHPRLLYIVPSGLQKMDGQKLILQNFKAAARPRVQQKLHTLPNINKKRQRRRKKRLCL